MQVQARDNPDSNNFFDFVLGGVCKYTWTGPSHKQNLIVYPVRFKWQTRLPCHVGGTAGFFRNLLLLSDPNMMSYADQELAINLLRIFSKF